MNNKERLQAIKNSIETINRYSEYLIEIKPIFDLKDEFLIKEIWLITWKDRKITGARKIKNNGQTNKKIFDYINNFYVSCYDLGLIHFTK